MTTDHKKDEDNFNRIQAVIQKHGTNVQRKLLEHHLSKLGLSFTNLLDTYGHEFYHLCYTMYTCCQCGPLDFLPNRRIFSQRDYESLFEKDGTSRLGGHKFTHRSRYCCNYAKSNISPNDLDFSLLAKVIPYCCEDLFWNHCLKSKGGTLEQFLNENKHDVYHMWKTDLPCPLCKNGTIPQPPKTLYLSEDNWNCLFVSQNTPLYPSSFSAKSGITLSQLNPHLRFSLILRFSNIIESIESLRVLRNRFAHSTDFKLTTCDYESIWCDVENAILLIAEVYGLRKEVQFELSKVCRNEFALTEVELKSILQELQNNNDIREQNMYLIQQNISIMNKNTEVMNKLEEINRTVQLKCEPRSWKELTCNGLQVKVTANESKTNIDSSVWYSIKEIPRRINLSYLHMKEKFYDCFKNTSSSVYGDLHNSIIDVKEGILAEGDTSEHHNEGVEEDSSDSDADDNDLLRCGNCGAEFKSLKRFKHHKKSHRIRNLDKRRQKAINTTITITGMPRNVEEDIVRFGDKMPSSRTRDRSIADIQIIDESLGSLVIWTKISVAIFKSKDIFLRALKEFLDKTFSYIPFEDDNDIAMTVSIQIEEGLEEDDMGDFFRCGICSKEFFALAAFEYHKKKVCERKASGRQLECSAAGLDAVNENGGNRALELKSISCKTEEEQNHPRPKSFNDNKRSSAHDKESPSTSLKQKPDNLSLPTNVSDSLVNPTPKSEYVDPSEPYYQERRLYLVNDQADKTYICEFITKDKCTRRYCRYNHIPIGMPYLWQINMYGRWLSFAVAENETIEKAFCDLQDVFATTLKYNRNNYSCRIRFNQMYAIIYEVDRQAAANDEQCKIRRLTTASFVEKDSDVSSFLTNWRWYWKNDEDQWIDYWRNAFLFTLEKKYLTEQKTYIFFRENFSSKFKIDFLKMTQVNLDTGKVRDIIRRPLFVSKYDVQNLKFPETISLSTGMNAPKPPHFYSWDYSHDFEFVELYTKDEEYREVLNSLQESMSTSKFEFSIIYRIQNRKLWSKFETKKKLMLAGVKQDGRSHDIGERHLFHGTDSLETCYGICTNNFDFRTSDRNDPMYGRGSYFADFAVHAKLSHSYTKVNTSLDNRIMFRSKVLVGQFTKGSSSVRRPSEIPGQSHKLYDSCVDDVQNPQVFVVFDRNQCYPEYLIMYKDKETISTTSGHSMTYALSKETMSSLQLQEGDSRKGQSIPESKRAIEKSKASLRKPKSVSKPI